MARKPTKKALQKAQVTRVCVRAIAGLQINIMDLSKISACAERELGLSPTGEMKTEAQAIEAVREYALSIAHVEPMKRHA